MFNFSVGIGVSTHSRPKAAGGQKNHHTDIFHVSTHSRPKAAGIWGSVMNRQLIVSTHSRPKAAGGSPIFWQASISGFNSQPPEGGWAMRFSWLIFSKVVSTHSRPKAAGTGWKVILHDIKFQLTAARRRLGRQTLTLCAVMQFQLTAARRRLVPPLKPLARKACIALFR